MKFSEWLRIREDYDSSEDDLPDNKRRNGLADPDPGELKKPHNPSSKDLDLAKQAVQLIMGRSPKWHRTLYKFLRKCGERIPDVGHVVDNMSKPKDYDRLFGPRLGNNDVEPDVLSPNGADSSPAFYQS